MTNQFDLESVCYEYRIEAKPLTNLDDPGNYITEINGKLFLSTDYDPVPVGEFTIYRVNPYEYNDGNCGIFDIMDAYSETIHSYWHPLFKSYDDEDFSESVEQAAKSLDGGRSILIPHTLTIYPEFRGNLLGLVALHRLIAHFAMWHTVIVIKPYPLQYSELDGDDPHDSPFGDVPYDEARRKLQNYWSLLGFVPLSDHPEYMVRSTSLRLPTLSTLLAAAKNR